MSTTSEKANEHQKSSLQSTIDNPSMIRRFKQTDVLVLAIFEMVIEGQRSKLKMCKAVAWKEIEMERDVVVDVTNQFVHEFDEIKSSSHKYSKQM